MPEDKLRSKLLTQAWRAFKEKIFFLTRRQRQIIHDYSQKTTRERLSKIRDKLK